MKKAIDAEKDELLAIANDLRMKLAVSEAEQKVKDKFADELVASRNDMADITKQLISLAASGMFTLTISGHFIHF